MRSRRAASCAGVTAGLRGVGKAAWGVGGAATTGVKDDISTHAVRSSCAPSRDLNTGPAAQRRRPRAEPRLELAPAPRPAAGPRGRSHRAPDTGAPTRMRQHLSRAGVAAGIKGFMSAGRGFREFLLKGQIVDLAVAVVVG